MFAASICLLLIGGLFLYLARPERRPWAGWVALLPPLAVTLMQVGAGGGDILLGGLQNDAVATQEIRWVESLGLTLSFRLDGLSLLFGLIISGVGAVVALYTHYYLADDARQGYFYLSLFAFMASMLGLVWADNLLTLFVFWEGTSITSFLLIGYSHRSAAARGGARNAFIVTAAGGLALLAGLVLLGQEAGSYTISQIISRPGLTDLDLYPAILALILLGAFTKSAQFPFHWWLPGAMAAPTPASAYLHSATMVKAGIYLLARLHPALSGHDYWMWGLLIFGGITMVTGAVAAVRHWDMKALLAYATVSQLGVLTTLLAFSGEAAMLAVAVGILAHALYKGPLFLVAGIVDHATGTRDLRRLAGLRKSLPVASAAALLAAASMAGLPPLFGFVAKEALLESLLYEAGSAGAAGWIAFAAAAVAGAFFVAYSLTLVWEAFLRPGLPAADQDPAQPNERQVRPTPVHHPPSAPFLAGPLFLVACGLAAPFALGPLDGLFSAASASAYGGPIHAHAALWHGFTPALLTSLLAIAAGAALFASRARLRTLLGAFPPKLRGVALFQDLLDGIYSLARLTAQLSQGYTLATQSAIVLLAACVPVAAALGSVPLGTLLPQSWTLPAPTETILVLLTIVSAFVTVRVGTRMGAIISLGVVGVTVTLFYVFFSAPDLALTQLLIEVLTLVLLVLVFSKLPPDASPAMQKLKQARNLLVSLAAGAFGFFLVLMNSSEAMQAAHSISGYFLQNSVPLGHGANVVNVILVDFRGFDTMGEITVLALAALGGYALLNAPRVHLPEPFLAVRRPDTLRDRQAAPAESDPGAEAGPQHAAAGARSEEGASQP